MRLKLNFLCTMVFLAGLLFANFSANAQNSPTGGKASISRDGKIALASGQALQYTNILDISVLKFSSKESAIEQYERKNSPLATFKVDYEKKELTVQIELRAKPDWTVEDWNKYLGTL